MKLKLPIRSIWILTRKYSVVNDPKLDAMGNCDSYKAILKINLKWHERQDQVLRTLWHEIGHAYAWESGLHSTKMTADCEEMFVETFSALICDLTGGKITQRR